jgi:predicted DNA-binding transcriptional regulator YafY
MLSLVLEVDFNGHWFYIRNMRKMERLLYILSLLRTNHRLKASDLARKCGVSERTIYRDVISISEANIPIYFDGGYRLLHDGFLPPVNLTDSESDFLLSLLRSTLFEGDKPYGKTARILMDKIKAGRSEPQTTKPISIGESRVEKDYEYKSTQKIEEAIREKTAIEIHYLSLKGEQTKRAIDPYALTFRKRAWYLIGYCHLRKDIRTFRLGRIQKVRTLSDTFEIPEDFSIHDYFKSMWGVTRDRLYHFKVRFSNEAAIAVKTSRHHPDESIVELENGDILYELIAGGEEEFLRWVLSYGKNAEITSPESSRKKIKSILGDTMDLYNSE